MLPAFVIILMAGATTTAQEPRQVIDIATDMHVSGHVVWKDAHYRVQGSIYFEEGGVLEVENAVIELMLSYTRQFNFEWKGGSLITRNVTIGGTNKDGVVYQCNFELRHGSWDAVDTTVRYTAGISAGSDKPARLHGVRFNQGPHPDSLIMSGNADATLVDSAYNISLLIPCQDGGKGRLDLPVNEPLNQTFDSTTLTSLTYRLKLQNTSVPLWWTFFCSVKQDAPPMELTLGKCTRLIPSIMGENLTGTIHLPSPWPGDAKNATLTVGNLTLKTGEEPVDTWCWGVYLWGDKTDLTLTGPTMIAELMVWNGKFTLQGTEGTYDAGNTCTTVEVGRDNTAMDLAASTADVSGKPSAECIMRNVALGRFAAGDEIKGQITAHGNARVTIENARCAPLLLITKQSGEITMNNLLKEGELTSRQEGGPITIK